MRIIIDIPEEVKRAFDCAESNDLKGCYYDHGGVIGNAIKNGTLLPKGHGDLKDMDDIYEVLEGWDDDTSWIVDAIDEQAPTIIDADKESD